MTALLKISNEKKSSGKGGGESDVKKAETLYVLDWTSLNYLMKIISPMRVPAVSKNFKTSFARGLGRFHD